MILYLSPLTPSSPLTTSKMSLSSLIRSFNHLSLPEKAATGTVAIAGIAALISIPVISLHPPRQPAVFNEDAYYQRQITDQSPVKENISSPDLTSLDTTTTPNSPRSNQSTIIPEVTPPTETTTGLDKTAISTGGMGENLQTPNNGGNIGSIGNPDNKPTTSSYRPPNSFSTNPDNLSSSDSYLKTPYSLPIPNISSSAAKPYSLQPSQGNTYTSPSNQSNPSSYNSPSTATTPTTTPNIPSEPAIAPNTLNGSN